MERREFIFRCMARRTAKGTWVAKCIDLDLVTEDATFDEARRVLHEMVSSYIAAVCDTEDYRSIPRLLRRKAPLSDRVAFFMFGLFYGIGGWRQRRRLFDEAVPVPAGAHCG